MSKTQQMLVAISGAMDDKGEVHATQCSSKFYELFTYVVDWHEFSDMLTTLAQCDFIEHAGMDAAGMNKYSRIDG